MASLISFICVIFFPLFFVCVCMRYYLQKEITSQVFCHLKGKRSVKTPSQTFLGDCTIKADITTYHFWSQTNNETLAILISLFMRRVFSNQTDIYVSYCTLDSVNFFLIIIFLALQQYLFLLTTSFFCKWKSGCSIMMQICNSLAVSFGTVAI